MILVGTLIVFLEQVQKVVRYIIEGYNITTTENKGIYVYGTSKYFIIKNCYIRTSNETSSKYGIHISNVQPGRAKIEKNVLEENYYGIDLLDSESNTIQNNTIIYNRFGMRIWGTSSYSYITTNIFKYNLHGIYSPTGSSPSNNLTISYNVFEDNSGTGIDLWNSETVVIDSNILKDKGCIVRGSSYLSIYNNTLSNGAAISILENSDYCTVYNNTIDGAYYGISFQSSSNYGQIINNTIKNSSGHGIYTWSVNHTQIEHNNITSSFSYGLYINTGSVISTGNIIYLNYFFDNGGSTSQAYDKGTDNLWYNETLQHGNHWSDWTTGNYSVDGDAGSEDIYPIDLDHPIISAMSHPSGEITDQEEITISVTVEDNVDIATVLLYYREKGGSWQNKAMTAGDGKYSATIGPFGNALPVDYYVQATDSLSSSSQTSIVTLIIKDTTLPDIDNIAYTDPPTDQTEITISATVTDNVGLSTVMLYYRINGGTEQSMYMTAADTTYSANIGNFNALDNIGFYIIATDTSDNTNQTAMTYFDIEDATDPVITNIDYTTADNEEITISATVTDNVGLSSVKVYYRVGGGTWQSVSMSFVGSTYSAKIGLFEVDTHIEFYINATDTSDNIEISANISFDVEDGTVPVISDISYTPDPPGDTDEVTVSANVIDNVALDIVLLFYRIDGGEWENITMTHTTGDMYAVVIGPFGANKNIEFYIMATDTSDNAAESQISSFAAGDTTPPVINDIQYLDPPKDNEYIEITANITDNIYVSSVNLYYRVNEGEWETKSMSFSGLYLAYIGPYAVGDIIEFYINASDSSGNTAQSEIISFEVVDGTPPSIFNVETSPMDGEITDQDEITITATVTDNVQVESVKLYYSLDEGDTWESIIMTADSSSYSVTIGPFSTASYVFFYIEATDNSGNVGTTYEINLSINDGTEPVITDISYSPVEPTSEDEITIETIVTDNDRVMGVQIYYSINEGEWISQDMTSGNGDTYSIRLGPFEAGATIEFYIKAIDGSRNEAQSETISITIADDSGLLSFTSTLFIGLSLSLMGLVSLKLKRIKK